MSKPRHSTSWRQQALIEVAPETVWELRSIRLRCLDTNTYTRFTLTPARGGTFVDIETGTESPDLWDRALDVTKRKRFFRGLVNRMLDGLRDEATGSERPAEKRTDLLT
jgi:hypothetical protein